MSEIKLETSKLFQNSIAKLENAESALELAWEELENKTAETIAELTKSGAANTQEIGERFAAAKQLRSSLKTEMRQAVSRLEFHLENSPMAVVEWDSEFRVLRWSPEAEKMFGWKTAEIIGKGWDQMSLVYEADCEAVYSLVNKLLDGSETRTVGYNRNYTKDGSVIYCEWHNSALRDAEGKLVSLLSFARDVTDRHRIQEELYQREQAFSAIAENSTDILTRFDIGTGRDITELIETKQALSERTEQLEATNKELESFSYSVSHDLRAPLRHISGFVNALKQRLEATEALTDRKIVHYIEVIEDSSEKMSLLIDGLLALSRVCRTDCIQIPIDLTRLVQTAIKLAKLQLVTSSVQTPQAVEFEIGDLPTVMGDPTLLQQVFSNLIDNAVKFSRDRTPARIMIDSLPDGTLFVKDNGVGFEMEYADRLFGVFQRLHSQKEFEGTGIGLAIAWRIIQRHGGRIWGESIPGQGATFYFKLG